MLHFSPPFSGLEWEFRSSSGVSIKELPIADDRYRRKTRLDSDVREGIPSLTAADARHVFLDS